MPLPIAAGIGLSVAGGLAKSIFGKDEWQMSPEERKYLDYIQTELGKDQGYSPQEKSLMLNNVNQALGEKTAGTISSLQRRGMASPGQMGSMGAEIGNQYGEAAGNIELASAEAGRRRKAQLENAWGNVAGSQTLKPGSDLGIPDLLGTVGYLSGRGNMNGSGDGFNSEGFMPGLPKPYQPGTLGDWRRRYNPGLGRPR